MKPLVSCCIITYNHAPYIGQAVESVLQQQHNYPVEIIVADDRSTDGTTAILEDYQQRYPSLIRLIVQEQNQGASKNFMQLLYAAKGKYIAYLEGDDYWSDAGKLKKQIAFLEQNPDFAICFSNVLETFSDDPADPRNHLHEGPGSKSITTLNDLLYGNYIQTSSVVFRNRLFEYFPSWYGPLMPGDWPLHILNAQFGKIFYDKECMSVHRNHSDGVWSSQKAIRRIENSLHVCEVIGKELKLAANPRLKAGKSKLLLASVKYLIKERKYFTAAKNLVQAFFTYPAIIFHKRN